MRSLLILILLLTTTFAFAEVNSNITFTPSFNQVYDLEVAEVKIVQQHNPQYEPYSWRIGKCLRGNRYIDALLLGFELEQEI